MMTGEMLKSQLMRQLGEEQDKVKQLEFKLKEANDTIEDLERELRVKDDLLMLKKEISEEPIPDTAWYEDRYQRDCIRINQLNVTIDVLAEKLARLGR